MGAPKQKWTSEEESALKAGVVKHGAGKWRTILKDPEYAGVLYMRSNVDLKDKWRNMSVMANGWGSRDKSRLAIKRMQHSSKQEENATSASDLGQSDEDMIDVKPSITSNVSSAPPPPLATPKKSIMRLDNLIMEALKNMKEPGGCNKTSIASYIEEQYWAPADFKRTLSATLKFLTSSGKLIRETMADGNESSTQQSSKQSKRDPAWQYGFLADESNRNDVTCIFCQTVTRAGIYRLKNHLAGGSRDVVGCTKCPDHVREEMLSRIKKKKEGKEQTNLLSEFDERTNSLAFLDDDVEVEAPVVVRKGKRPMSSETQPRKKGSIDRFFKQRETPATQPTRRQTTINEAYKKEARAKMCEDIARFVYKTGIPFAVLGDPDFIQACDSIAKAGRGAKPPTPYEVRVPLLKREVERVNEHLKIHRDEWALTGCSIMSDGWTDRCQRTLVNFLVNCSRGSMFLESVDATSVSKTGVRIFNLLSKVVVQVGDKNVVQVISDNGANFKSAGKLLEATFPHLYWTPCAAHCIDLVLEDISKVPRIDRAIKKAIQMCSFIYQRPNLLNLMRQFTKERNLLRPAKTRFATSFITLSSIYQQKLNLKHLFQSVEWMRSSYAKEAGGRKAANTVMLSSFWDSVYYTLQVSGPLVRVLRLVDSERKPAMGYIYEAMDRAKEAIAATFKGNQIKYFDIFQIIDKRWECQLHHPLHAAGYFLNPEFFYSKPDEVQCEEVVEGLYGVIKRLNPDLKKQDKIMEELSLYKRAEGLFGNEMAIRHRAQRSPAEWWSSYGISTPTLQQFAIRILSLTCSASGCERNWSTFEHVKRNYRIPAAAGRYSDERRNVVRMMVEEGGGSGQIEREMNSSRWGEVDSELAKMRNMSAEEAAAAAAQAVAEAEAAIAEAEEAAREADAAEADAAELQAFAEAANRTLRGRTTTPNLKHMVRAAI